MQLHFNAISEPGLPGEKWQKLYNKHWQGYRAWYRATEKPGFPDLQICQGALKRYMPEMWPTYVRLCKLAKADKLAARFLTGFQPPAYISGCSQAMLKDEQIRLARNYDYHPDLFEGAQLLTSWNGKKVIATSDCLVGALDGMNEDGLSVSLAFGGRKVVGSGFGIPFILRYVLEFCSNVEEAVKALIRIPCHMSYNVLLVDKSGVGKTVYLAPEKIPVVNGVPFTTNHQETVDWPENAVFNRTVERYGFLENLFNSEGTDTTDIIDAFLQDPLYSNRFKEGFGTLYTAIYRPEEGIVDLRWPNQEIRQSFKGFREVHKKIDLLESRSGKNPALRSPYRVKVIRSGKQSLKIRPGLD